MTEIWARRTLAGFVPLDASALQRVPLGELVQLVVRRKRSVKRHNYFMAFVQCVFDNLPADLAERWPTFEKLLTAFKVLAGHADYVWLPGGREAVIAKSIRFHKMDEDAFAKFMDTCMNIWRKIVPNLPPEAEEQIFDFIGYRRAA